MRMMLTKLGAVFYAIVFTRISHATLQSHGLDAKNYSSWMLDSIIAGGGGIGSSGAATSQIELVCTVQETLQTLRLLTMV